MFKHIGWKLLTFAALASILAAQQAQTRLQRLVGIAAEDGIVALDGNKLSVFSTGNIRVQDATSLQWKLADKKSDAMSIKVEGAHWQEVTPHLSVSAAYGFALCDPLNQVDLRSTNEKIRSVLPAGAKVKSVVRVSDDLSLVVYSVSGNTVSYDIRVGIVANKVPGGYALVSNETATDAGNYCGVQQGNRGVFFLFANEPSGSSDFSSVYVYSIVGKDHSQH